MAQSDFRRSPPRRPSRSPIEAVGEKLRRQHARIAELEAEIAAVGAGGVQALSAAPAIGDELRDTLVAVSAAIAERDDRAAQEMFREILAASPAPPAEQQAAPKAEPGVGNSGFDYKTAADFLNGKTVSDEAVRKFVAASRWAHDERAALSATLLAMHGVLTSREAEIALLKKALLEAEAAPQQAVAGEPVAIRPDIQAVLAMLDVPVIARMSSHEGKLLKPGQEPPAFESAVPLVREWDHRRACESIIAALSGRMTKENK